MKRNSSAGSSKTRLITAATKIFSEKGYHKATLSEIAKDAGLSEASIYEYFKSKEDLLLTIPVASIKEQFFGVKGAFNKLRKFLWWYLRYIERNPLIGKVIFLNLKTNRDFMDTESYSDVKKFYSVLIKIFEEGIESGEIKQDLNPYLARNIFLGTIEHMLIRWLLKDMSYPLFDNLEEIFQIHREK